MVQVLAPVFRTAGHQVRTEYVVTASAGRDASAGKRRGDVQIMQYLHQAVPA
jgi:hypothetical protein